MREGRIRPSLRVRQALDTQTKGAAMREGRIRPSLGPAGQRLRPAPTRRNEGGANSPLVAIRQAPKPTMSLLPQ